MDNSFHYLLMATHAMVHKQLLGSLKETGLTIGQPKVLDYLHDHDGASQTEIARACHIEAATLTSLLNRMEEKQLLVRRTLHGNRRTYYIFLTPQGREMAAQVQRMFAQLEQTAFDGLEDREQAELQRLLCRVYENLAKEKRSE